MFNVLKKFRPSTKLKTTLNIIIHWLSVFSILFSLISPMIVHAAPRPPIVLDQSDNIDALPHQTVTAQDLEDVGLLDVTTFGADPTGATNSTTAIQDAIDEAYTHRMAVFFPPGTYVITDTLEGWQDYEIHDIGRQHTNVMIGSTSGPNRPVIKLADNTEGFETATAEGAKPIIYFHTTRIHPPNSGNIDDYPESGFAKGIRGIDFEIGSGNPGAIALQIEGAQDSFVMNTKITMHSGFAGMKNLVGTDAVLNNIEIIGGKYGIHVSESRWPTISDLTLTDQTDHAIYFSKPGTPLTIVGFKINKATAPVIRTDPNVSENGFGGGTLTLIDGTIELESTNDQPVIDNTNDTNVMLHNVYVQNGDQIIENLNGDIITGGSGWYHVSEYAYPLETQDTITNVGRILIDGTIGSSPHVGTITAGVAPPTDLRLRHALDESAYPSPDVILNAIANNEEINGLRVANVKDHSIEGVSLIGGSPGSNNARNDTTALQQVINDYDMVFLPRGIYLISDTLTLHEDSHIIGVSGFVSQIRTHSTWTPNEATPMIQTVDDANAQTKLSFFNLTWLTPTNDDWFEGIHWQAGRNSEVVSMITRPYGNSNTSNNKARKETRITGNGGGRWFGAGFVSNAKRNGHADHRKLWVKDTTEPLILYGLNVEDGKGDRQAEFDNVANVLIYGFKAENDNAIYVKDSNNFILFGAGGDGDNMLTFTDSSPVLVGNIAPKNHTDDDISLASETALKETFEGDTKSISLDKTVAIFKRGTVDFSPFFDNTSPIPTPTPTATPDATPIATPTITPTPDGGSGGNLLPNPSFESDPNTDYGTDGETEDTFTWANEGYNSSRSLLIDRGTAIEDARWFSKRERVLHDSEATSYTLSGYFKSQGTATDSLQLVINYWDANLAHLSGTQEFAYFTPSGDWQAFGFTTQAPPPANAVYVRAEFRLHGEGDLWIDEVSLTRDTTPATPEPVAEFTADIVAGLAPLSVTFDSQLSQNATNFVWDFGDGNSSDQANPTHQYLTADLYTVVLQAGNGLITDTITKVDYIQVVNQPEANFEVSPRVGVAPLAVTFSNNSTEANDFIWDLGDGTAPINDVIPPEGHTYNTSGTYLVTLQAGNGILTDTVTQEIRVLEDASPDVGFLAHWPFDETSGDRLDQSENNHHLPEVGTVGTVQRNGNTAAAPAGGNYLSTNDGPLFNGNMTVAGWFKLNDVTDEWQTLAARYEGSGGDKSFRLDFPNTGSVRWTVTADGGSNTVLQGSTTLNNDQWYHVAAVFDASAQQMKLYIDGQLDSEKSVGFSQIRTGSGSPLKFGQSMFGGLDDWYMFDRVLIAEEITGLYDGTWPPPPPSAAFSSYGNRGFGSATTPLVVTFTNESTDADQYIWDFGDDSELSDEVSPTHQYQTPGSYDVSLTAIGPGGSSDPPLIKSGHVQVVGSNETRVETGLQAIYTFTEGEGNTIHDVSGVGAALDLTINDPTAVTWSNDSLSLNSSTTLSSGGPATKLIDAIQGSQELTLEAWVTPANTTQDGPARIVSMSGSATERNLTLGQGLWGNDPSDLYNVRLRTSNTDNNGLSGVISSTAGSLTAALTHVVYTRDVVGQTKLYLNGVEVEETFIEGDFAGWDSTMALLLGNETTGDRPWLGTYHLVAFYNRALSLQEVADNYGAGETAGPVWEEPFVVNFTADQTDVPFGEAVQFSSATTTGAGDNPTYLWDFGDGNTSTEANPSHTYTDPDKDYTVSLTVTRQEDGEEGFVAIPNFIRVQPLLPPVAHWALEESNATRLDGVGNIHHLTETASMGAIDGQVGLGASFLGNAHLFTVDGPLVSQDLTVAGWVNLNDATTPWQTLIARYENNGGDKSFRLQLIENGLLQWSLVGEGVSGVVSLNSSSALSSNTWHHVAGVYEASSQQMRLYVDGVVVEQSAGFGQLRTGSGSPLKLGDNLTGVMDEWSFYDRALSEIEITALMNEADTGPELIGIALPEGNTLTTADGTAQLEFTPGAVTEPFEIFVEQIDVVPTTYDDNGEPNNEVAPDGFPFRFYDFTVQAVGTTNRQDHIDFSAPVILTVQYQTEEVFTLDQESLRIFGYNQADSTIYPLASTVDLQNQKVSATLEHFSPQGIGGDTILQNTPAIDAFEVSLAKGQTSYSYDIPLPTGPNGFMPKLTLQYGSGLANTSSINGWIGGGWSLELGEINRTYNGQDHDYNLILNGTQEELIEGDYDGKAGFSTRQQTFMQVVQGPKVDDFYLNWMVKDRAGTTYYFGLHNDDLTTPNLSSGADVYGDINKGRLLPIISHGVENGDPWCNDGTQQKYKLHTIQDVHGNIMRINYEDEVDRWRQCDQGEINGEIDAQSYPSSITYTTNSNAGDTHAEYIVKFVNQNRTNVAPGSHRNGYRRLDYIQIEYKENATAQPEVIRVINFEYDVNPVPDHQNMLSEIRISDGSGLPQNELPTLSFDYVIGQTGQKYQKNGKTMFDYRDRPFLQKVSNGYGGEIEFIYKDGYNGYFRVVDQRIVRDTVANVEGTYTYAYSNINMGGDPYAEGFGTFRGFEQVTVTDPQTQRSVHTFNNEGFSYGAPVLNGRLLETWVYDASDNLYSHSQSKWVTVPDNPGLDDIVFVYQSEQKEYLCDGENNLANCDSYSTGFAYDTSTGNLTTKSDYDHAESAQRNRLRYTDYKYITGTNKIPGGLLKQETVRLVTGEDPLQTEAEALTQYFYDGNNTINQLPTWGNLTRTRTWFDLERPDGTANFIDVEYDGYDAYGNATIVRTFTDYAYGPTADPTSASANPRETTTTYDQHGILPLVVQNDRGHTTSTTYDYKFQLPLTEIDPNGATTTYGYDSHGRPKYILTPLCDTVNEPVFEGIYPPLGTNFGPSNPYFEMSRQRVDPCYVSSQPIYAESKVFYDGFGRKIQAHTPGDTASEYVLSNVRYDNLGRLIEATVPTLETSGFGGYDAVDNWGNEVKTITTYDVLGRVTRLEQPDGSRTKTFYNGFKTAVIDAENNMVISEVDPYGRLERVSEFLGIYSTPYAPNSKWDDLGYATTHYEYDTLDNLTKITDHLNNETIMEYNNASLKTFMDDPDMGQWHYEYDPAGNLISQVDAKQQATYLYYDRLNRLLGKAYNAGPVDPENPGRPAQANDTDCPNCAITYTYDQEGTHGEGIGRRTSMSDDGGTVTWAYDLQGRLTKETRDFTSPYDALLNSRDPGGSNNLYSTHYTYTAADLLLTLTYPDGETVTTDYTLRNLPEILTTDLSLPDGSTQLVKSASYNALANPTQMVVGSDLATTYEYYSATAENNRLERIQVGDLLNLHYTAYDDMGNILGIKDDSPSAGGQTLTFGYDKLNRLTSATGAADGALPAFSHTYDYDQIGNITVRDSQTYNYPASGVNSVRPHAVTSVGSNSYQYDANGNMTVRIEEGITYNQAWTFENKLKTIDWTVNSETYQTGFVYDGDGNRLLKIEEQPDGSEETTVYIGQLYEETFETTNLIDQVWLNTTEFPETDLALAPPSILETTNTPAGRTAGLAYPLSDSTLTPSWQQDTLLARDVWLDDWSGPRLTSGNSSITTTATLPSGVSDAWWQQAQTQIQQAEYDITWQENLDLPGTEAPYQAAYQAAYQAPNRAQNLRTYFTPQGLLVVPRTTEETSAWMWEMRLDAYGYADRLSPVAESSLVVEGNRAEYHYGQTQETVDPEASAMVEWYVNNAQGVKQGFTLAERPGYSGGQPLVLALNLSGDLTAEQHSAGEIALLDATGDPMLHYGGLWVYDATGQTIPAHLKLVDDQIQIVVAEAEAVYPLTIDPLVASPSWTVEGDVAGSYFGTSIASAGDLNADGFDDIIVGVPDYDNGQAYGKVFVWYGRTDWTGIGLAEADWTAANNSSLNIRFGDTVASAGDVNDDGIDDIIIGAPSSSQDGSVFIWYGGSPSFDTPGTLVNADWQADLEATYDPFIGPDVRFTFANGDVNGDQIPDIIVGVPSYDGWAGEVLVWYGAWPSPGNFGTRANVDWRASVAATGEFTLFGASLADADVNGDGIDDIIIGAPHYGPGATQNEGKIFVWYGGSSGPGDPGTEANADWTAESNQIDAYWGYDVKNAGDINGDGADELMIGVSSPGTANNEAEAFVWYGSTTEGLGESGTRYNADWQLESGQDVGISVAGAGDVNGDGYDDVALSFSGQTKVWYGTETGLWGDSTPQSANWTVAERGALASGDVNGDGFSDLLIGQAGYDGAQANVGKLSLYLSDGPSIQVNITTPTDGTILGQTTSVLSVTTAVEPGLALTVRVNDTEVAASTVDTGLWSGAIPLVEGPNTVQTRVIDSMGDTNTDSINLWVDLTFPLISLTLQYQNNIVDLSWSATDPEIVPGVAGAGASGVYDVSYHTGDGVWQPWLSGTSQTSAQFVGSTGTYIFRLETTDNVGNLGSALTPPIDLVEPVMAITKYYTFGSQRVAMRQGDGASTDVLTYLHGDHLGSTSLTTDKDGALVSEVRYSPYGKERWTNDTTPTDFGFTNQRNEASFGLMDYNARYYSPVLGRFISPDTIVPEPTSSGGFNRYRYTRNNPLKYTDPTGHYTLDPETGECFGGDCDHYPGYQDFDPTSREADFVETFTYQFQRTGGMIGVTNHYYLFTHASRFYMVINSHIYATPDYPYYVSNVGISLDVPTYRVTHDLMEALPDTNTGGSTYVQGWTQNSAPVVKRRVLNDVRWDFSWDSFPRGKEAFGTLNARTSTLHAFNGRPGSGSTLTLGEGPWIVSMVHTYEVTFKSQSLLTPDPPVINFNLNVKFNVSALNPAYKKCIPIGPPFDCQ